MLYCVFEFNFKLILFNQCLGAGNRYRMQQLQQQDWCEQQIRDKQRRQENEKQINKMFDEQSLQFNNLLGQTQSDHNQRRIDNERDTQNIN